MVIFICYFCVYARTQKFIKHELTKKKTGQRDNCNEPHIRIFKTLSNSAHYSVSDQAKHCIHVGVRSLSFLPDMALGTEPLLTRVKASVPVLHSLTYQLLPNRN